MSLLNYFVGLVMLNAQQKKAFKGAFLRLLNIQETTQEVDAPLVSEFKSSESKSSAFEALKNRMRINKSDFNSNVESLFSTLSTAKAVTDEPLVDGDALQETPSAPQESTSQPLPNQPQEQSQVFSEQHPIRQFISLNNKEIMGDDALAFKGFSQEKSLTYNVAFGATRPQEIALENASIDSDTLQQFQKVAQSYYSTAFDMKKDDFSSFDESTNTSLLNLASLATEGRDLEILIHGLSDLSLTKELVNNLSSHDVHVLPQTRFSEKVARELFETVLPYDSVIPDNSYDIVFSFNAPDDRVEALNDDYSKSFLRADEQAIIKSVSMLKEGGQAFAIIPSELSESKRAIFTDELKGYGSINKTIRLPLQESSKDFISFIKGLQDDKPNKVENVYGGSVVEVEKTVYSPLDSGGYLAYNLMAYEKTADYDFSLKVPLSTGKEVKSERPVIEYSQGCFYRNSKSVFIFKEGAFEAIKGIGEKRARAFLDLHDSLTAFYDAQKNGLNVELAKVNLESNYKEFVDDFGNLLLRKNERFLQSDYRFIQVAALEIERKNNSTGEITYERSSFEDKVFSNNNPYEGKSLKEGCLINHDLNGRFNLEEISDIYHLSASEVEHYLIESQLAFKEGEALVHKDIYLSGEVLSKLKRAVALNGVDPSYSRNVKALEAVIPKAIPFEDIHFSIGAHWMDPVVMDKFLMERTGSDKNFTITKDPVTLRWNLSDKDRLAFNSAGFNAKYGAANRNAMAVLSTALNSGSTIVFENGAVNLEKSEQLKQKVDLIQSDFRAFVSGEYKTELEHTYNSIFNGYVRAKYHASTPYISGMNENINLRQHQLDASQISLNSGNSLMAHDAGSGKTFTQVVSAVLSSRRTGKNSLIAVPNHMPRQIMNEAILLFPEAKILYLDNAILKDKALVDELMKTHYDLLIMKHDSLNRYMKVPDSFERDVLNKEKSKIFSLLDYYKGQRRVETEIEKGLTSINKRLSALEDNESKIDIDTLNISRLIVDEAHNFKNLEIQDLSGAMVDKINGSARAFTLKLMTEYLYKKNGSDSGVVFATGTPVSNSLLEIFNLQRYLQPALLQKLGLNTIKNWSDTFLDIKTRYEPDATGKKYIPKNSYVLKNIPELISILSNTMNIVTLEDAGIKVPDTKMVFESCSLNEEQRIISNELIARLENIKAKKVPIYMDNMLKVISDSRKMALSPGMIVEKDEVQVPNLSPKLLKVCDNIFKEYQNSEATLGAQLAFCDLGTPSGFPNGDSIYDLIKNNLIERGMPSHEIAFIHDPKNEKQKEQLFSAVREGSVRLLIGSTAKMGEGTNVQERLVASHDIDPPWRPKDIIQRRRRTVRQGNQNEEVTLYVYMTENSFDSYVMSKLDNKNKAFSYVMSGKGVERSFELDLDPTFAEAYAVVTGRPELLQIAEIEGKLLTLTASKNNLQRESDSLKIATLNAEQSIVETQSEIDKASLLEKINNTVGWSVSGLESTRKEVLANRTKDITFNGYKVVYSDKWTVGGFCFKRPVDIEKHINFEKEAFLETSNNSIRDSRREIESLNKSIDTTVFDQEIATLTRELDAVEKSMNSNESQDLEGLSLNP